MTTKTTDRLSHAEWCEANRIENTEYPDHGITTTHCLDCAAHEAKDREGKTLAIPAATGGARGQGRDDLNVTMERAR